MNKIVASIGLVALGAASVRAQQSSGQIVAPAPKWWNISATVQGFYDDNANTAPTDVKGDSPVRTFGYSVSPSVGVSFGNQQTTFSANYTFSYLYYEKSLTSTVFNPITGQRASPQKDDMDHSFTAALDHAFSERYTLHVSDSFIIGQDPDTLRAGNQVTSFYRIPGDNTVNSATLTFDGELTPLLGFEVGYNNVFYNYNASALGDFYNRDENDAHFNARFTVTPETVFILGYQFGDIDYFGHDAIGEGLTADARDTISHTVYAGVEHTFLPELVGTVQAGASYYDYYNDPNAESGFGPYAMANLSYTYAPESSLSVGFQEGRSASGLTTTNSPILDTEASTLYASLVHRIMPRLYGSLKGTFQNSTYNGGGTGINGRSEQFYEAEAELTYKINTHFSMDAGYSYNRLSSGLSVAETGYDLDYDRNRVYIGATASY